MKTKVLLILMICLTVFSLDGYAQEKKSKKNNKEQVVFNVEMDCESCKKKIEKNIPFEKGVSNLKVDLPGQTVMVQFNPQKTDKEKLQKAIEGLGYKTKEYQEADQE